MIEFSPIADGIFVARTSPLDVNTSLVIGDETALVIDTLSTDAQAEALIAAIRPLTSLPLTVLNTHYHFDHSFGNAVVASGGRPIWGHPHAAAELRDHGSRLQLEWVERFAGSDPEFAAGIAKVNIQIPDHLVRETAHLDLGGRIITIAYHGRAHTDGDVVAIVEDADVIFAGDLVEESGPPAFGSDSYPLEWPNAVAALLEHATASTVFVPGHGAVTGTDFVVGQHGELADFAWLIRDGHAAGATIEEIAIRSPWPSEEIRSGVVRGYANLDDPVLP